MSSGDEGRTPPPGGTWLSAQQVRRLRVAVLACAAVISGLGLALGITLPRSLAYRGLVDENMALKWRLQEIDRRMSEVDRMLLRLRLYDAHLKSLGDPVGDHGPLPERVFANHGFEVTPDLAGEGGMGEPMEELGHDDVWVQPADLRPAEAWALSIRARVETFLALAEQTEPDLTRLMEELEDLRALEAALPSAWPAKGVLTSGFGWRRSPIGRANWRFHSGIDISNVPGTPIHAPAPGRVVVAETNSGYGRFVAIDHGFGITTSYAHCTRMYVQVGDLVQRGDLIATVGSTGRSTGPHLHFEVRLDGHPVDPLDYLPR